MDLNDAKAISLSGMNAQSKRLRIISENLANADSTSEVPGGDPYRRKVVTFKSLVDPKTGAATVSADKVVEDQSEFITKYDPNHPAADAKGYVKMPNVSMVIEMADMREAQRSYEANLTALKTSRGMVQEMVDLLRQ